MHHERIIQILQDIGAGICDQVHRALREQSISQLSAVHEHGEADTIYAIDKQVEDWLVPALEQIAEELGGIVLIAEGIGAEGSPPVLPAGLKEEEAALRMIIDPIDGTRGIMYDKRSAFFLAAVAPNRGAATTLRDLELAVMVELPISKGIFSDSLSAIRGKGVNGFRRNLLTGEKHALRIHPSAALTILGGFAQISRFFPNAKKLLAEIEEELAFSLFPDPPSGKAILFEDQYISSGGQLYELLMGHDRFTADLRGAAFSLLRKQGIREGLTCHPYDVCAHLIGTEAGIVITGVDGAPLDGPLDTTSAVDWIAYANESIRTEVEPVLQRVLREKGLLPGKAVGAAGAPGKTMSVTAYAPGRLDVMGGVADYSGSLLLQMPLKEQTSVTVTPRRDGRFRLHSANAGGEIQAADAEVLLQDFYSTPSSLLPYGEFRRQVQSRSGEAWPLYVLGCFYELIRTKGLSCEGADIEIVSQVPLGKGVSSSAALEVATLKALVQLYHIDLPGLELPILAQRVENLVVGAPCGLMDQLSSYFGRRGHLLPIRCQPAAIFDPIPIPAGVCFGGIDSGVRHAVSGDPYGDARTAAFMGYSIIAQQEGVSFRDLEQARQSGDWSGLPYEGYLANIDPGDFHSRYARLLPETLSGDEFLSRHGISIDTITTINPKKNYAVLVCARHPVEENRRIQAFNDQLLRWDKITNHEAALTQLGAHMIRSHRSYSAIGLGSERTDELVEELMQRGPTDGIYGARITGGGSGGTVAVLCYGSEGIESAKEVADEFGERYNYQPVLFNL